MIFADQDPRASSRDEEQRLAYERELTARSARSRATNSGSNWLSK